ncbi:dipeptide epimerase [Anatilimnocola floriformis]|uniref:dipeptide epimerase n=1 Tax=Anatilimnocola floriformis TaxID=2948575 RepID=UPI0020C3572B|nr:dipeptide epimerase [Anatilimnocola floriformis]
MQLKLHSFDLPLAHTFTISRESINTQPTLIVELRDGEHRGYGEATANKYYGATIEAMTQRIETLRPMIETATWNRPEELWQQLQPALASDPFSLCAIDQAAHDLWGKRAGKPVYEMWGLSTAKIPASNYTIGIDTIPKMLEKLQEFPDWPIYKIKLGTANDIEIVRELRKHTSATFRVDANCGWSAEQALEYAPQLKALGVEFIEQPLPADRWEDIRRVRESIVLPIIADESCIVESDVRRCAGLFHGINIKLVKCGGLTPARRMIAEARQLGLSVMVGCMTESTVGISAIAQLLPLLDYVDMDGAVLLAKDIATGVRVERGICHYPDAPGTGVQLLARAV